MLSAMPSHAINFDELTDAQQQELMGGWKPIEAKNGAISWKLFAKTKEVEHKHTYPDKSYAYTVTPEFGAEIKALKDKPVKLMGYMFPLSPDKDQREFLFGPYPVSCPYHYHTPPSMIVEVHSDKPIAFTYDPLTVEGTLSLDFNEELGVFYFLKNARLSK